MAVSHNPFHSRAVSLTRDSAPDNASDGTDHDDRSTRTIPADIISEELPPAYTPTPDVYHGETTLEVGPRRPFQPPPQPPNHRLLSPTPTSWRAQQLTSPSGWSTSSGWSNFPAAAYRSTGRHAAPLPSHPSLRDRSRPGSAPHEDAQPLSDFAREFYAAGARVPGEQPETSLSAATSSQSLGDSEGADDGRPTENPTPGHPLLRHGKVLVYSSGHECDKCHNTGYRNNDPTTPCLRCWDKYGRPFSGALAYTPWGSASSDGTRHTLQRPLPRFTPPHLSKHRPTQSYSGESSASASHTRSASLSRAQNGYPGAASRVIPIAGGGVAMSPYLDPLQRSPGGPAPSNVRLTDAPPPGATVVHPGDPRIGGRLCWRCGGSGTTTFLVFDEMPCNVCNGLGRTFQ